tara:strand:- start:856 stop:1092 length:237 start_codon:yes stop_codon:yes gene_type:complete
MFKKMLRKFLEIDELENQLTQIDKELQDNIEETACHRNAFDDTPSFYDMETHVEQLVRDWVNDSLEGIVERLKKLEDK